MHAKAIRTRILCMTLAALLLSGMSGCSQPAEPGTTAQLPESTAASCVTTEATLATDPTGTTVPATDSTQTAPTETVPVQTTQPVTIPPETTVPVTVPPETTQPTTVPPDTTPVTTVPQETTHPTTVPPDTTPPTTVPQETTQPETTAPPVTAVPEYNDAAISNQTTVEASGTLVKSCADAVIDYSNTRDGYVMVCYTSATDQRLKAQVAGPSTTYTYNLTAQKWAAFPLSDENGTYQITVYKNVTGSKYAAVLSLTTQVTMDDAFAPFLHSNQYVSFDEAPKTRAKAAALTRGMTDPLDKVAAVYNYVVEGMTYDSALAATVQSGYLPDLDRVLEKMSGICFDYAALMAGMLRSQGVPTKLVVGYAGQTYHAWISVWSESTGWIDGVIYFDGTSWNRMDPTFASSGGGSSDIMNYIGDGTNYTAKYFY